MDTVSDEVIDRIAAIEMQRREVDKEAGRAAACNGALRSLQELLDREQEALRLHGPDTDHPANIDAVMAEVSKVRRIAAMTGRLSLPEQPSGNARQEQRNTPPRDAPRNPSRNRGRRTMGRSGGR
jgi:hypothetical protein